MHESGIHNPSTLHLALVQSMSYRHSCPSSQELQSGPPQSIPVSFLSKTPLLHDAMRHMLFMQR